MQLVNINLKGNRYCKNKFPLPVPMYLSFILSRLIASTSISERNTLNHGRGSSDGTVERVFTSKPVRPRFDVRCWFSSCSEGFPPDSPVFLPLQKQTSLNSNLTRIDRQGCALAAPGRLRQLTFGLGRLKKKSGRPSGRLDFGFCENPKRNAQTIWNGRKRKKLPHAPALPFARKTKADSAVQFNILCDLY